MKNIAKTISKVRKSVGAVDKNGVNAHHKYKYQAWEDVLLAVRSACEEHGLLIIQNATDHKKEGNSTVIAYKFTLVDTATGESIDVGWIGEGGDTQDKGTSKAGTSAYKYFCLKLFQITTKDDEDPDGVSVPNETQPKTASGYSLPLTDSQLNKARKMVTDAGLDWEEIQAECEVKNLDTAVKVSNHIKEKVGT